MSTILQRKSRFNIIYLVNVNAEQFGQFYYIRIIIRFLKHIDNCGGEYFNSDDC